MIKLVTDEEILDIEIWKDVLGFEGLYKASSHGRVWSIRTNKEMKGVPDSYGYLRLGLYKENKRKYNSIHRIVAESFIPNPENKPQVNHIDENIKNNTLKNLEWVTEKENSNHGTRNIRMAKTKHKKIDRYSLDGEYIDSFNSIKEAKDFLGCKDDSNISKCCKGKMKSAGGYRWKYAEIENSSL